MEDQDNRLVQSLRKGSYYRNLRIKNALEIFLFGFCAGVLVCILIHYYNNGIR